VTVRIIYRPAPVTFPGGIHRVPVRPVELRDEKFDAEFDWDTFTYDSFRSEQGYCVIAPPMFGLESSVDWETSFAGRGVERVVVARLDKALRVRAASVGGQVNGLPMQVAFRDAGSVTIPFDSVARNDLLAGKRVLVTMSKDNEAGWICDWMEYHAAVHGAQAAIVYDNGSSRYTPEELLEAVSGVSLEAVIIVSWPFKYGPQGIIKTNSHWDSNFCQHGGLEHARYFFLQKARSFLNCDIDELIVPFSADSSVFDAAEQSDRYVYFAGQWVEPIGREGAKPKPLSERRHLDFIYMSKLSSGRHHPAFKYCVAPRILAESMQCATHRIVDAKHHGEFIFPDLQPSQDFNYRHFKAINTNWRWQRDWIPAYELSTVDVDSDLDSLMMFALSR
jgi:hypothetical protein